MEQELADARGRIEEANMHVVRAREEGANEALAEMQLEREMHEAEIAELARRDDGDARMTWASIWERARRMFAP